MSRKSKRRGSVGTFFFGSFIGFILCLAIIASLLCFIYFKVSPQWLNKNFKTEINLGSEEANKKTVGELLTGALGLVANMDSYTISDLKGDFGIDIKDEYMGIKIDDLKNVPLTKLGSAIENKFGTISAEELRNVDGMNLEAEMGNILDKKLTYHYNPADNMLYKTSEFKSENAVTFAYKISDDKTHVITKGHESPIVSGTAKIEMWYLPLTVALGDFTETMGDNITIAELKSEYGVKLPSYFNNIDTSKTINQLKDTIDTLYVADFLGYTLDNTTNPGTTKVMNGSDEVKGVMAIVAKETIGNLSNLKTTIDGTKVADILGMNIKQVGTTDVYYDDKNNNNIKDDGEKEVSYVLKTIAGTEVQGLSDKINGLHLDEIFSPTDLKTGILSIITDPEISTNTNPTISQLPEVIKDAFSGATISTLMDKGIITINVSEENRETLTTKFDHDNNPATPQKALQDFKVNEFIEYSLNKITIS